MADIPSQISFEQMLSHLFPGLFLAITIFMLLDILSPADLTLLILKDINALIAFAGLLFIAGTILGIIIDAFHHDILEPYYFNFFGNKIFVENRETHHIDWGEADINKKYITFADITDYLKIKHHCVDCGDEKNSKCKFCYPESSSPTKIYYFLDTKDLDKYISIYEHIRRSIFHYYEFYVNTFVCMVPFTIVAPVYIHDKMGIDAWPSIIIAVALSILSYLCLHFSFISYQRYMAALYFAYCRCGKLDEDERFSMGLYRDK
jgi:hypothetical protein